MTDRQFITGVGEDMSPLYDLTDEVIWEECEFGLRAYLGESTATTVRLRDEDGRIGHSAGLPGGLSSVSIQAHNVAEWRHGSNVIWRGRVSTEDYGQGDILTPRAREIGLYCEDVNRDLAGISVVNRAMPAQTDVARLQSLIAFYLSGSYSPTRVVNGSNLVNAGSNTVNLAAKTYTDQLDAVFRDVADQANKTYYLLPRRRTTDTHTAELFYDGNDAVMELCPYRITDNYEQVEASPDHVFYPIWDMGPASRLEGQEVLSDVYLFYGSGENDYVHAFDAGTRTNTARWEQIVRDPNVNQSEASSRANSILSFRKYQERTVNVSIGPLGDQHIGSIRAGQTITIQAKAIPFADDTPYAAKIGQLNWTSPLPGMYFAHLQLERPWRSGPYRSGGPIGPRAPRPATPPGGGTPDTILAQWHFDSSGEDDDGNGYFWNLWSGDNGGCVQSGSLNPGISMDDEVPVSASTQYTISASILNRSISRNPAGVQFYVEYINAGGSEISEELIHTTSSTGFETFSVTVTTPVNTAGIEFNVPNSLTAVDNVVLSLTGSGTPPSGAEAGDISPDLVDDPTDVYAPIIHYHHLFRDEPPTADDDEADGLPLGTRWIQFDDLTTPTQIVAIYILQDDEEGAAVWFQEPAPPHVHDQDDIIGSPSSGVVDHGSMGTTETFDFADGTDHEGTLDDDLTVTLDGATDGEAAFMTLVLTQDGTGGHSITLPAALINKSDLEAAFDTTASATNVLTVFTYDGGTTWYGALMGATAAASGHYEVLMASGSADPLETSDGLDWLYVFVED